MCVQPRVAQDRCQSVRQKARSSAVILGAWSAISLFLGGAAVAGPLTITPFEQPFTALENSGTQTEFIAIDNNTTDIVAITNIALSAVLSPAAGEADDMASNPLLDSPQPTVSDPLRIAAGGTANIRITWEPLDLIMAPGTPDFGSWYGYLTLDVPQFRDSGVIGGIGGVLSGLVIRRLDFLVYDAGYNLPEPASLLGLGLGLTGLLFLRRRRA